MNALLFPVLTSGLLIGVSAAHATGAVPVNVTDWGAICDGASHPIGSTAPYDAMSDDQLHALFHFYAAPTDEVDGLAINQTLYQNDSAVLPATPASASCVVNMSIVTKSGNSLSGQDMGATTVRFELAAGKVVPDYPLFLAGGLQAQRNAPVSKVGFSNFTVDGGWPPDGQHLGSPSPKAGAPGPVAFFFGSNSSRSNVTDVEVYHEYGTTVQVSGSYVDVTRNFLHDNWGPTIHVSGTVPAKSGAPIDATHVNVTGNTLSHNSLQNYPAMNANGGYGGLPALMTGNGRYFVYAPAGLNVNCPGTQCLGANDAITLDPMTRYGVISGNTVYGGDILVSSYGYYQAGTWYQDQSGNDSVHDNTIIASSGNGASVDGIASNVTIQDNKFENMISMLNAGSATPPTLAQQFADSAAHACDTLAGTIQYVTIRGNVCSGGTLTPDYSVYPPSFTSPAAVITPSVAWGVFSYPQAVQGTDQKGPVLAPNNVIIEANTYVNVTQAASNASIIDFKTIQAAVPDNYQITGNIFQETRGLTPAPFEYSIDLSEAGEAMSVHGNTPLMGSKGIANVLPGQNYTQGH